MVQHHQDKKSLGLLVLGVWSLHVLPAYSAPENLNPGDFIVPTLEEDLVPSIDAVEEDNVEPESEQDSEVSQSSQSIEWESLAIETTYDFNNFAQINQRFEPTLTGTLANGDQISITSGFNRFEQEDIEGISNIPLIIGWQRQLSAGRSIGISGSLDSPPYYCYDGQCPGCRS
ncbi:MAG: hypothetical protein AAF821_12250 [Cyanobacteria bacterium P01_D01_bin.156]